MLGPFELTGKGAQISVLVGKKNSPGTSVTDPLNPRAKSRHAKGTFTVTKDIVKSIGIRGLYTGYHLHLVRDTLGTSIYFMCYESSKQILATYQGSTPTSPIPVAIAGGLCGVTYPIDSAKTIYQRSVMSQLKVAVPDKKSPEKVKITYFDKSMYAGSSVSIARSFILNSILFSTFEGIKKVINEMEP
ncbi:MAG: hypothetical protein M1827_005420 [Pycnora praestabilis]|nr:MAG: hypothetical protein M1827_005420 [Pycnora praestabilis]